MDGKLGTSEDNVAVDYGWSVFSNLLFADDLLPCKVANDVVE